MKYYRPPSQRTPVTPVIEFTKEMFPTLEKVEDDSSTSTSTSTSTPPPKTKYAEIASIIPKEKPMKKEPIKEKEPDPLLVLEALSSLHERRKQKYILYFGNEEYEKNFRFNNYDYDYFTKLDEKYQQEQEELEQEQQEWWDEDSLYE